MRSKMKKKSRYLSTEEIKRISNAISDIEQSLTFHQRPDLAEFHRNKTISGRRIL